MASEYDHNSYINTISIRQKPTPTQDIIAN